MTDNYTGFVNLPEAQLALPSEPERYFPMRITDWDRLHKKVAKLKKMRRDYTSGGWALVGFAASAALGLVVWVPAYGALPPDARLSFAWITPAFVGAIALGAVLGCALLYFAHRAAESQRDYAEELQDEMKDIRPATA